VGQRSFPSAAWPRMQLVRRCRTVHSFQNTQQVKSAKTLRQDSRDLWDGVRVIGWKTLRYLQPTGYQLLAVPAQAVDNYGGDGLY
jgi:hypothetical protein